MIPDPTNEIRAIRDRLSAACDYDVDKIVDEARRHQAKSGCTYVNLSSGQTTLNTTNQSTHGSGDGSVVVNGESTPPPRDVGRCYAMKRRPLMLELLANKYRIAITNDPTHSVGSADNVHSYDHEYALDEARAEYAITSRHAVRVSKDNDLNPLFNRNSW